MTELKLTKTESMWMGAMKLDDSRHTLIEAVRFLEAAGSDAVHSARFALLAIDDGRAAITKEGSE